MSSKNRKKRIIRNRSSKIWMETLEQRQLLAPIFGSADITITETVNPGSKALTQDPSLSSPPVSFRVMGKASGQEEKLLGKGGVTEGLVVKII